MRNNATSPHASHFDAERKARIVSIALVLAGIAVLSYPLVCNCLSKHAQARAIECLQAAVDSSESEELEHLWVDAREYNRSLKDGTNAYASADAKDSSLSYDAALDPSGNGVMAILEIPAIHLRLPVYHGTSEQTLRKGAGHLEQTALPTGDAGCRPVITGHRGLPESELFTRLDELEMDDVFTVQVLDETLEYRICTIETVGPEQIESIAPIPHRDLVTLITCTPYGANTHRLLITGERVGDKAGSAGNFDAEAEPHPLVAAFVVLLIAGVAIIRIVRRRKRYGRSTSSRISRARRTRMQAYRSIRRMHYSGTRPPRSGRPSVGGMGVGHCPIPHRQLRPEQPPLRQRRQ